MEAILKNLEIFAKIVMMLFHHYSQSKLAVCTNGKQKIRNHQTDLVSEPFQMKRLHDSTKYGEL